jgi:hypothetical protein
VGQEAGYKVTQVVEVAAAGHTAAARGMVPEALEHQGIRAHQAGSLALCGKICSYLGKVYSCRR